MTFALRSVLMSALLVCVAATSGPAAAQELDGMYLAQGTNPDGSEYRGLVQVQKRGDSYVVSWLAPQASNAEVRVARVSVGVGILSGDTLAVSYSATRALGVAMYRIENGGQRLVGRWATLSDDPNVYTETLQKLPASATPERPFGPEGSPAPAPDPGPASPRPQTKPQRYAI
jgi:hypothetical protein